MAAQPKNKITRVEQGKRRHGNTPKLLRDLNKAIPPYKRGLFEKLMNVVGVRSTVADEPQAESKKDAKAAQATQVGSNPMAQHPKSGPSKGAMTVKKTTRTQHKGG